MLLTYRILEMPFKDGWSIFGVAYQREGEIRLFSPTVRGEQVLQSKTLEELNASHLPSQEFRWQPVTSFESAESYEPVDFMLRELGYEKKDLV